MDKRQIVLDTETTGLEVNQGHRIIEIGCVEMINRRITGRHYHQYIHPQRDIDAGALEVHGITLEFLAGKPTFEEIATEFAQFVEGAAEVIGPHHRAESQADLEGESRLEEVDEDVEQGLRDEHDDEKAAEEDHELIASLNTGRLADFIGLGHPFIVLDGLGPDHDSDDRDDQRQAEQVDNTVHEDACQDEQADLLFSCGEQVEGAQKELPQRLCVLVVRGFNHETVIPNSCVWARSGPMLTMRIGVRVSSSISLT